MLIFVVQRGDVKSFSINNLFYPEYGRAIKSAVKAGVELVAFGFPVSPKGFGMPIPLKIN
jgi:DNA-binding sugar fermentation-stimulating protein